MKRVVCIHCYFWIPEEKVPAVKSKNSRLVKRLSLARGAKHLEKAAEKKRNSTGSTTGQDNTYQVKVKPESGDALTRKKIALTTVSNIGKK